MPIPFLKEESGEQKQETQNCHQQIKIPFQKFSPVFSLNSFEREWNSSRKAVIVIIAASPKRGGSHINRHLRASLIIKTHPANAITLPKALIETGRKREGKTQMMMMMAMNFGFRYVSFPSKRR